MARAAALVLKLARKGAPDKSQKIRLAVAAAEASLPEDLIVEAGRWTDERTYEAVYGTPTGALHVLQGLQDAVRRVKFLAAVAAGEHWSDVVHLEDQDVTPHALSVARALGARLQPNDAVWIAFQGFGAWDEAATAAFSLTCNVRHHRSRWQRAAEQAYRQTNSVQGAAEIIGLNPRSTGARLRRASIRHVDLLDLVLARQLDAQMVRT